MISVKHYIENQRQCESSKLIFNQYSFLNSDLFLLPNTQASDAAYINITCFFLYIHDN